MAAPPIEGLPAQLSRVHTSDTKPVLSPASTFTWCDDPERQTTELSKEPDVVPKFLRSDTVYSVDDQALHGYPKLATFISSKDGCSIYKRFASLNARNLLYHQAELVCLEHELNDLEQEYANRGHKHLHYKVHDIRKAEPGSPGYALRKKHEEVSNALDNYNRLLLDQARLHKLPKPDDHYVSTIHNYINNVSTENPAWLEHPENTIYLVYEDRKAVQTDLVTLDAEFKSRDPFSRWFTGPVFELFHKFWSRFRKPDDDFGGYNYSDKKVSRAMTAIVMIISSALPTSSIVALYFIPAPVWRLVFIVLFSAIFAACLAFFTEAKRVDIFTASVALASVQVVFVGTAFGNGNQAYSNN